MAYDPWLDVGQRYPQYHVERLNIAPYRAVVATRQDVIFVDSGSSSTENRCALAHEIAHLDAGDEPTSLTFFSDRQETAADRVAASRLIPLDRLVDAHLWTHSLHELADECWVDIETMRCRLDHLTLTEYNAVREAIAIRDYHEEGMT